jgi:hypothetical protein
LIFVCLFGFQTPPQIAFNSISCFNFICDCTASYGTFIYIRKDNILCKPCFLSPCSASVCVLNYSHASSPSLSKINVIKRFEYLYVELNIKLYTMDKPLLNRERHKRKKVGGWRKNVEEKIFFWEEKQINNNDSNSMM